MINLLVLKDMQGFLLRNEGKNQGLLQQYVLKTKVDSDTKSLWKNHLGINKSKTLCLSRFFSQKGCKCIRYSAKVIHPSQRSERTKSQPIGLNNLAAAALSAQLHTPPLINFCYDYSTTVVLFSSPTRQTC